LRLGGYSDAGCTVEKARSSFLKKRSKKLLVLWLRPFRSGSAQDAKVFWFFFSKKNRLLPITRQYRIPQGLHAGYV
jgi:hypothetical protein